MNRIVVVEVLGYFQQKVHNGIIDVTRHRYRLIQLSQKKKIESMVSLVVRRHRIPYENE